MTYEEKLIKEFKKGNFDLIGIMFSELNVIHPQFMFLLLDEKKEPKTDVVMAPIYFSDDVMKFEFALKVLPKMIADFKLTNKLLCIAMLAEVTAYEMNEKGQKIEGSDRIKLRLTFETESYYESFTWDIINSESGSRYLGKQDYYKIEDKSLVSGLFTNLL
jgi:hypothetical protein